MELNSDLLEAVLVALAALLGGALGLALTALVLKYAAKWSKDIVAVVRRYQPQVIAAVDQPTDAVPLRIDALLDRVYPGDWNKYAAAALPAFYRALADALESALPGEPPQEAIPPQEVRIP